MPSAALRLGTSAPTSLPANRGNPAAAYRLAHVLLAGTDSGRLEPLAEVMSENNYTVHACAAGPELSAAVKRCRPDLAIIDLASAEEDAFCLAAGLRADPVTAAVPVVLVGASGSGLEYEQALESGAEDIFAEPFDLEEILVRLKPLVRLSTMRAELGRRAALARTFGVEVEEYIDSAKGQTPYIILAIGPSGGEAAIRQTLAGRCAITACGDFFDAGEKLNGEFFDICVIALEEAGESGPYLEFCDRMRDNPRLFNLPLVMLAPGGVFAESAEPYRHGATRVLGWPAAPAELGNVLVTLAERQRLRWKIRQAIDATRQPATSDELTGGYSFAFLLAYLEAYVKPAQADGKHLTLVFLSVPEAENVRREFGDAAADHLIQQLSQWITRMVRAEDMAARYGEHDFCIALPDTCFDEASLVMRRVAGVISYTDFAVIEVYQPIAVAVEMGIAELEAGDDADSLIKRAHGNL